ncbi:uncharacterized protein LOC111350948 [Spodoptera litura]|uniref:Uncharacterized protein LOC111350948 n=1 Tax=Spodoptera litura TaxID=69820 RepID=A0A9J7ILK2_SPOLT|nr:uncharacterized protein LOC111350948 [Spodoptera litura]
MKSFIVIIVLSALVASYEAFVLPSRVISGRHDAFVSSRQMTDAFTLVYDDTAVNGTIMTSAEVEAKNDGWRLLYEVSCSAPAAVGRVKNSFVTYQGPTNTVIDRITITPQINPANVYHSALGTNNMEVRLLSNISQPIQATVRLYQQRSGAGKAFGEPAFHLMFFVLIYFGISNFT